MKTIKIENKSRILPELDRILYAEENDGCVLGINDKPFDEFYNWVIGMYLNKANCKRLIKFLQKVSK